MSLRVTPHSGTPTRTQQSKQQPAMGIGPRRWVMQSVKRSSPPAASPAGGLFLCLPAYLSRARGGPSARSGPPAALDVIQNHDEAPRRGSLPSLPCDTGGGGGVEGGEGQVWEADAVNYPGGGRRSERRGVRPLSDRLTANDSRQSCGRSPDRAGGNDVGGVRPPSGGGPNPPGRAGAHPPNVPGGAVRRSRLRPAHVVLRALFQGPRYASGAPTIQPMTY